MAACTLRSASSQHRGGRLPNVIIEEAAEFFLSHGSEAMTRTAPEKPYGVGHDWHDWDLQHA